MRSLHSVAFTSDLLMRTISEGTARPAPCHPSRECRMRLVRLVAAGLVLGALAGFLGALLRPRSVHSYHPVPVDHAAAWPGATPGSAGQAERGSPPATPEVPAGVGDAGAVLVDTDAIEGPPRDVDLREDGPRDRRDGEGPVAGRRAAHRLDARVGGLPQAAR